MIKKLFILGLLLIPSFSFASNNVKLDIGEYSNIGGNNCTVNLDLSFDCSNTDNVIVGTDSSWLNRSSSYFRTTSGLAYYGYKNSDQSTPQGYVSKFKYCGENGNPLSSCNSSSTVSYDSFIEYYNSHELTNRMWYSVQSSDGMAGVAFIFGNSYFVFVPEGGTNYVGVLTSYNFGLSGWGKQANYGTVGVIDTPLDGVPIDGSYDIGDIPYTYGQIVEGYEACGLDVGYCYGGFSIDDIFEPNQTIEDFTGYKFGYGANIWYLYSLYSSTYTPKQFFNQMLLAYNNGQINRFKNEPKALIMFVQQYVSGKERGLLNVGFYDLWDYCNIKLGYTDLNLEYTGHNQTPKTCYKFKVSNESNQGGYTFTGDNAYNSIVGTGKKFKNASQFFGNLSSIFNNGIGSINTNYEGFIPTYILVFMFAFIFIRLISK